MLTITRTARFTPGADRAHIAEELACPSCGFADDAVTYRPTRENRLRVFCDGCGAFVVFTLSAEQAEAVRALSSPRTHAGMSA